MKSYLPVAALGTALWITGLPAAQTADNMQSPLDHFKCYLTRGEPSGAVVRLRDQFGADKARVLEATRFCNPVAKRHRDTRTDIRNPDHHLTLYRLETAGEPRKRQVVVSNQFGKEQRLEVGKALFLAVPTHKRAPGEHQPPKGLDHFLCYQARGDAAGAVVDLKDQFHGEAQVKVDRPFLLCNPVEKTHGDVVTPIEHRDAHLVCYRIEGEPLTAEIRTRNQFGAQSAAVKQADLLCAPSAKKVISQEPVPGEVTDAGIGADDELRAQPPKTECKLSTSDFVVTGSETLVSGDEHCFASDGAGNFPARSNIHGLTAVDGMDVADLDGDGDNDFLACDGHTGDVYLYTQGPASAFTPSVVASGVTAGTGGSLFCTNLREGDFDGNGLADFVVGDNRVTRGMFVYLQGPVGIFTPVATGLNLGWASPSGASCNCLFGVAAGDVDGDGRDDVLVLGYAGAGAGQLWFYQGNGAGGMAVPVLKFNLSADFPVVSAPTGLALFDFEGDGDLDIIAGGAGDGSHYVYTNDGIGNFAAPAAAAFDLNNYTGIDAYDFDGDGDHDLVLADWTARRLIYVQNLGGALAPPVAAGTVEGNSIGIGAPQLIVQPSQGLDHFKCYPTVGTEPIDTAVSLRDQFGTNDARVQQAVRFCNPVEKRHSDTLTPIRDRDHHLMFYRIKTVEPNRPRSVEVSNQFGIAQQIKVGDAIFLAVPTQKRLPGNHLPPKGLDHFECYRASGAPVSIVVGLRDQFHSDPEVKVGAPAVLCNPVAKKHGDMVTEVQHPAAHLMCYRISGAPFETNVRTRNQFGEEGFRVRQADLVCVPSEKRAPEDEPHVTHLCGDLYPVSQFDGGEVLPGGPGTGLYKDNPDGTWPDGRPRRPCGQWVAVHGFLPVTGVDHFRIAYRKAGDPAPAPGDPATDAVASEWRLNDIVTFCTPNPLNLLTTQAIAGHGAGWMNRAAYEAARLGISTGGCPNPGLRLAAWRSQSLPDPDDHYVLWLEWEDGGVFHREPLEHHLQLDNTLPVINDLLVTLEDGTSPVGACGEAPAGEHLFKVHGDFFDDYAWGYLVRVRGGNPPTSVNYGWHDYHDGTPAVANTGKTGTTPVATTVFLRDIDMNDFGAAFTDCCYLLELFVRDAAIRHAFPQQNVVYENTSAFWDNASQFITFAAAP